MTYEEFEALPLLSNFMPLIFVSGNQRWEEFFVFCNDCSRVVPKEQIRGTVVQRFTSDGYRTNTPTH